ncbi:His-Xaa-Ser system radical SAM maturase HxsB [Novosphingobium terrae]|uniref:His-Xaa-Ser system radical SAM maturase HxsB n=1 Tax=Novosphingobium terrae TaxID=2726189 RepID=UPI001F13141E|nr:His-Xaa-Ser system radical SAM maturase HxsB [Novosphingobium terrae]
MMVHTSLKARPLDDGRNLCVAETGSFFLASGPALDRLEHGWLDDSDRAFLGLNGHVVSPGDRLASAARTLDLFRRSSPVSQLDYLILVPTLRCNLSCSYCQVSRVAEGRKGFDWSEETLAAVLACVDSLEARRVKIEFQGGEPTLRPDLIRAVMERCARFERAEFVICTNLQNVTEEVLAIFDRPDVFISTSLDGDAMTHGHNRTGAPAMTEQFLANLRMLTERYGPTKISALPTIDPVSPPDIDGLIQSYVDHGFESIFLRPINFQGFARKRHKASREQGDEWRRYYEAFVRRIIRRNWEDRSRVLEETYFSIALRRIFYPGRERHVDLRSPNPMGVDYIVVDHDGTVFPTDEARMLSRSGVIDLSIGTIAEGWNTQARDTLNRHASNDDDPACRRCAYQPYCGRDLIDDIARYGRIDMPREETEFCRRHLHLFDFVFTLIYDEDPAVRYSLGRWLRLPGTPEAFGDVLA